MMAPNASRAPLASYEENGLSPLSLQVKVEDVPITHTHSGKGNTKTNNNEVDSKVGKATKTKSRKRVNTAEKRASHNAVERQRREQLNGRFLDLARLLPSLANLRRPSKSAIVNGSINHLTLQREQRLLAARELRSLFAENQEMLSELNEWRARSGLPAKEVTGWTKTMEEIVGVESEIFGNFTGMGNGDGDGEGEGDDNNEGEGEEGGEAEGDEQENEDEDEVESGNNAAAFGAGYYFPPQQQHQYHGTASLASSISMGQGQAHNVAPADLYNNSLHSLAGSIYANGHGHNAMGMTMPIPIRQMSFAPTEHSSVLSSNSPPQFRQSFGGASASPIEAVQQMALQAFLNGDMSTPRSPHGSGGVVTPPPHESLGGGSVVGGLSGHNVQTFAPASPPTAPTSFSTLTGNGDKVSEWAAQQFMLQFAQERASAAAAGNASAFRKRTESMSTGHSQFAVPTGSFANLTGGRIGGGSGSFSGIGSGSGSAQAQLGATHQALLANHPQLAAVAFPPPFAESTTSTSMPLPSPLESVYSNSNGHNSTLWSGATVGLGLGHQAQPQPQTPAALVQNPLSATQMQQFFAANAAAVAQLNPALQGMTYENMEQWMRASQSQSQSQGGAAHGDVLGMGGMMGAGSGGSRVQGAGGKTPSIEDFRDAVRAGINLGLAGLA